MYAELNVRDFIADKNLLAKDILKVKNILILSELRKIYSANVSFLFRNFIKMNSNYK